MKDLWKQLREMHARSLRKRAIFLVAVGLGISRPEVSDIMDVIDRSFRKDANETAYYLQCKMAEPPELFENTHMGSRDYFREQGIKQRNKRSRRKG